MPRFRLWSTSRRLTLTLLASIGVLLGAASVWAQTVGQFSFVTDVGSTAPGTLGYYGMQIEAGDGLFVVRGGTAGLPFDRDQLDVRSAVDGSLLRSIQVHRAETFFPTDWPAESLAIDAGRVLVGAFRQSRSVDTQVFELATGAVLQTFAAPADADGFGFAVALDGNLAVVSDPFMDRVHVFDVTSGNELTTLEPTEVASSTAPSFGQDVAISDGRIAISDQVRNAVYLYNTQTLELITTLRRDEAPDSPWFGSAIDLEGDQLVVGAFQRNAFNRFNGKAFLYDLASGSSLELVDDVPDFRGVSGYDVEFSDGVVAVGASALDGGKFRGEVFLFNATTRAFLGAVKRPQGASSTRWGWSVALDGRDLIVGNGLQSFSDNGRFYDRAGRAYLYRVPEPDTTLLLTVGLATIMIHRQKLSRF